MPKNIEIAVADYSKLNIAVAALGPSAPKCSNRSLGNIAESHWGIYEKVIDMAVIIEVHRQSVSMSVMIVQRLPMFILACQFWTMDSMSIAYATYYCTMK